MGRIEDLARAKELRDVADYLSEPYRLGFGDNGVIVFDPDMSIPFSTGEKTLIVEWLRKRADSIDARGKDGVCKVPNYDYPGEYECDLPVGHDLYKDEEGNRWEHVALYDGEPTAFWNNA